MAMQNVFNILVDLKVAKTIPQPLVTQNDSVVFILEVMEDGVPFDLTDTTIVSLAHTRKDQTVVVTPGTKVGNKATFTLGTNETSITGAVTAKAQFYDAEGRVSTLSFGYSVGLDPTGSGYEPSVSEQTLIEVVLNDGPLIIASAEEAAAYANEQGDYALQVGVDNETRYLNAVETVALRDSTYPSPSHGDTVRVTTPIDGKAKSYRYVLGTGWVVTDVYNSTAIDEVNQQLADKAEQADLVVTNSNVTKIKKLKNSIVAIGDSTMAGTPSFSRNIPQWLSFKLRKTVTNKGIWGDTLQGIYARLDADVIALNPKTCIILAGTNNINGLNSITTLATHVRSITDKLVDNSIQPVWCAVFPRSDKPELMPAIRQFNYWLFNYCNENNIPFADTFSAIANPDGTPKAGMLLSTDNLHLDSQATINASNAILGVLPVDKAVRNWRFGQTNDDEFFPNVDFSLDANADGLADGWLTNGDAGAGVWSLENNVITPGSKWQVVTKNVTGATATAGIYTKVTDKFTIGKKYRVEHDLIFTSSNLANIGGLTSYIFFMDSVGALIGAYHNLIPSAKVDNLDTRAFIDITIPVGAKECRMYVFANGTAGFVLKVSNVNVYEKVEV